MIYVVIALAWLAVGAAVGVIEARHGYWRRGWVISAIFGPLAVPLALQRHKDPPPEPVVLATSHADRGPVDVLVGIDGSESSLAAAELALGLFGSRLRRVTLATVLDYDSLAPRDESSMFPEPWPEEIEAREILQQASARLRAAMRPEPGMVVLAGDPAEALERHARDEGYEVIVIGCRGRGVSKLILGSCASRLACQTTVPVLLVGGERRERRPGGPAAPAPD